MKDKIIRQFKRKLGYTPDLENPMTLNEKIAVMKLNHPTPFTTMLTDKIQVKNYVKGKSEALPIPTIYEGDDYTPSGFPFVAKPNDRSGATRIIRNSRQWDDYKRFYKSLRPYWTKNYETNYKGIDRGLLIEPVLTGYLEFKLLCFHSEVKVIQSIKKRGSDRITQAESEGISYFDTKGNRLEVKNKKWPLGYTEFPDVDIDRLIKVAETLSKGLSFVRIDLLWQDGTIYFGEYSFFIGGGYTKYNPAEFDRYLGSLL